MKVISGLVYQKGVVNAFGGTPLGSWGGLDQYANNYLLIALTMKERNSEIDGGFRRVGEAFVQEPK